MPLQILKQSLIPYMPPTDNATDLIGLQIKLTR